MNTSFLLKFLSDETIFKHSVDAPEAGDIALWLVDLGDGKTSGHTGVVTAVDGDNVKLAHALSTDYQSAENSTFQRPETYHPKGFKGYFRPKNEKPEGKVQNYIKQERTKQAEKLHKTMVSLNQIGGIKREKSEAELFGDSIEKNNKKR